MWKTIMVSGKFDPPHEGHIDHILEASKLGDFLYVVTHKDNVLMRVKGKCNIPLWARVALLKGLLLYYGIRGEVFVGLDEDGRSTQSILYLKPNIYAKGGDRASWNIPGGEVEACTKVGCELKFGIGRLLNSSSQIEASEDKEVS